ncbi:MAG TPA: hypothetical protein VLM05_16505 [Mycobacteriales bacterium]|nr:hypothetical protein [Mycobacteriales bacterium]
MSEPMDPRREPDEHGEWDALAVGWALSALDPEDAEIFAAHLPGCARCTATVRESLYTVADLAYALPDEAPPAGMKARLMAAVTAEPQSAASAPDLQAPSVEEQWPLGEPHPGTPGFNSDWFADHQPPARNEPVPPRRAPADSAPAAESRPGGLASHSGPAVQSGPTAQAGPGAQSGSAVQAGPAAGAEKDRLEGSEPAARAGQQARPETSRPDHGRRGDHGRRHAARGPASDDGVVVPMVSRRRRITTAVAAAAAVALIAALGVWNLQLRSDQDNLQQIVAQREAAIQQLTANEPARVAALTGDGKPSATRQATLVVRGNQVEIIIETLGATSANETYWLWTLRCDTPQPTDLKPIRGFTVTQPEFSVRDIGSDPGAATATCFALSSEVGTATPTTPRKVVAVGQPR